MPDPFIEGYPSLVFGLRPENPVDDLADGESHW
jgi:hypothetical protein